MKNLDHEVRSGDRFTYALFPTYDATTGSVEAGCTSTALCLDLRFDDGSRLSDLAQTDQHLIRLSPEAQHASKTLVVDQWNLKVIDLSAVVGRTVEAVELWSGDVDMDGHGWLDTVEIGPDLRPPRTRPTDYVETTRGTHASHNFSRGNNAPLTAVPHGFNFITPVTDASTSRWIYAWHADNGADNRPALQALSFSHIPSPWIGDRAIFQVMPSSDPGRPRGDRAARALSFDHADEVGRAHIYRVTTSSGLKIEMAPTDHAAIMRFTFPGDNLAVIFDQVDGHGSLCLDQTTPDGLPVVTGHVGAGEARDSQLPPMYVYGVLDRPTIDHGLLNEPGREDVCGFVRLDPARGRPGSQRVVQLRIATSYLSVEQAARNLEQEIDAEATFADVEERAENAWAGRLGLVEVEGATEDQRVTLYSNLYRLFLYPNSMSENAGTSSRPELRYASPFHPSDRPHTDLETGCRVVEGECTVNNGFWDTYHTCWPALDLLAPERAGALLDGFVQHFRDGGWTARWSAPGYADCMVGTSSDIVLADAFVKDVPGIDWDAAYLSAVRNATVPAGDQAVGRNGLETAIFAGYVATSTTEGMSWTLESAINDHGLAVWSQALLERGAADDSRRDEYAANAVYFRSRSLAYATMFDDRVGFFQGRNDDGSFRLSPDEFDPAVWGHDFTETNGWGMAFSVPHDGAGLAALYGGRDALEAQLDAYFTTDETAGDEFAGSYGRPIHEMTEARTVRMGMLGLTNQPAHHTPYMYLHTDAPHKTHAIVRECVERLYVGSEIGQGYLGDEDNGEMSAWWLFGALGFYPVSLADSEYALTAPLFDRASVTVPGGTLRVVTHDNTRENVYIQSVSVNGKPWDALTIDHATLASGPTIEVTLGATPSDWGTGTGPAAALISVSDSTPESESFPAALADLTGREGVTVRASVGDGNAAVDDTSVGALALPADGCLAVDLAGPASFTLYTLTGSPGTAPRAWRLEGSSDGETWSVLDERTDETFRWDRQTRPFLLDSEATVERVRLTVLGTAAELHQIELLAAP